MFFRDHLTNPNSSLPRRRGTEQYSLLLAPRSWVCKIASTLKPEVARLVALTFISTLFLSQLGCEVKSERRSRKHHSKPDLELTVSGEESKIDQFDETAELKAKWVSDEIEAWSVFLRLRNTVLFAKEPLLPSQVQSPKRVAQLELLNLSVKSLIETKHSHLGAALKDYEKAIFSGCTPDIDSLKNCDRHLYFLEDRSSADIGLYIASQYRERDWRKYFLLLDFVYAVEGRNDPTQIELEWINQFPRYWIALKAGNALRPSRLILQKRVHFFQAALCGQDIASEEFPPQTYQLLSDSFFSSRSEDALPISKDCLDKLFVADFDVEKLGKAAAESFSAQIQLAESPDIFSSKTSFTFPEALAGLKSEKIDTESVLHTKSFAIEDLESNRDTLLFAVINNVFQGRWSTDQAENILSNLHSSFPSSSEFHAAIDSIVRAYLTTYMTYLAKVTHKRTGKKLRENKETGQNFLSRLRGDIPQLRAPWTQLQKRVQSLSAFLDSALWSHSNARREPLPEVAQDTQNFLADIPLNVKYIADIPASIMVAIYMVERGWSVTIPGQKVLASSVVEDIIDGKTASFFDFSVLRTRTQNDSGETIVAILEHEVKYGFDFMFRLKIQEDYSYTADQLFEAMIPQYMHSVMNSRPGATFRFMDDNIESLRRMLRSQETINVMNMCDALASGLPVAAQVSVNQFKFAAALGTASVQEVDGRSNQIMQLDRLLSIKTDGATGSSKTDSYNVDPQYDNIEYLRTTVIPRLNRLKAFLELYEHATADQGINSSDLVAQIEANHFGYYKSEMLSIYDIYLELYPKLLDCLIGLTEIEHGRQDFLIEAEFNYFSQIHTALELLDKIPMPSRELPVSEIKRQHPDHSFWMLPIFKNFVETELAKSLPDQLSLLELIKLVMNTPHLDSQKEFPQLRSVLAEQTSIQSSEDGTIRIVLTPQRFAYRARNYFENGYKLSSGSVVFTNDPLEEQYVSFPKSLNDIRALPQLKEFFNFRGTGATKFHPEKEEFVKQVMQNNERYNFTKWFGFVHTESFEPIISGVRLKAGLIKSMKTIVELRGEECKDPRSSRQCLLDATKPHMEEAIETWARFYELLEVSESRAKILKVMNANNPFAVRNETDLGFEFWVTVSTQYILDQQMNVLPYFDYLTALIGAPFIGTNASEIPNRIHDSGSSPWELKQDPLRLAKEFHKAAYISQNHFGFDKDGNIRADKLYQDKLTESVQHHYDQLRLFEELVKNVEPASMTPINMFVNEEEPTVPELLNRRMLRDLRLKEQNFHRDTHHMFQ